MFKEFTIENLEKSKERLEVELKKSRAAIKSLLKIQNKTYENFVKPYQEIAENLNEFVTPLFHIDSVKNTKTTQKVQEEIIPLLSNYETELSQNEHIYTSLKTIHYNYNSTLNNIHKKVLENEIRDFKLGGCGLDNEKKKRLKKINLKLSQLSNTFSQNLLDATNAFEMVVEDFEDVKEIPQSDLA
ncbi:MAG: M3 family peptidase, partial [Arcobacteraceae bacterium]|nr:M3 family peptidase [Arcobacteraceae bacterium]